LTLNDLEHSRFFLKVTILYYAERSKMAIERVDFFALANFWGNGDNNKLNGEMWSLPVESFSLEKHQIPSH